MALPHLGITEEVRVCDSCFLKRQLANAEQRGSGASSATLPPSFSTGFPPANYGGAFSTGAALQGANLSAAASNPAVVRTSSGVAVVATDDFEADMRKAIELSLKESDRGGRGAGYAPAAAVKKVVQEPPKPAPARTQVRVPFFAVVPFRHGFIIITIIILSAFFVYVGIDYLARESRMSRRTRRKIRIWPRPSRLRCARPIFPHQARHTRRLIRLVTRSRLTHRHIIHWFVIFILSF